MPGAFSRGLQPFDIMGLNTGKSLFAGGDPGLWVTDGTTGGTSELSVGINPMSITVLNASKALFNAVNASSKHGLWVSDGTSAGTSELSVAGAASGGLDPTNLFAFGGEALFAGTDAGGHQNLWITDGTAGERRSFRSLKEIPRGCSATLLFRLSPCLAAKSCSPAWTPPVPPTSLPIPVCL